jgi:hypothetical protein
MLISITDYNHSQCHRTIFSSATFSSSPVLWESYHLTFTVSTSQAESVKDIRRWTRPFYLDIWPVGQPLLMLIKPELIYQLTQTNQLPKDPGLTHS